MRLFVLLTFLFQLPFVYAGAHKPRVSLRANKGVSKWHDPQRPVVRKPRKVPTKIRTSDDLRAPALEVRESDWLKTLGINGENGLYANEKITKGQFIGWYEGKAYPSVRKIVERIPHQKNGELPKELSYILDVRDPKTKEYLYSVDGFQPTDGSLQLCFAAYANHKPTGLTNAKFSGVAVDGYRLRVKPALFAQKEIQAGEEIIVDYGQSFESTLQNISETYRNYLRIHQPHSLMASTSGESDSIYNRPHPMSVSQFVRLVPALKEELSFHEKDVHSFFDHQFDGELETFLKLRALEQQVRAFFSRVLDRLQIAVSGSESPKTVISEAEYSLMVVDVRETLRQAREELSNTPFVPFIEQMQILNQKRIIITLWRMAIQSLGRNYAGESEPSLRKGFLEQALAEFRDLESWAGGQMGHGFNALREVLEAPSMEHPSEDNILSDAIQMKLMADELVEEDQKDELPFKTHGAKELDRALAIRYYQSALYILSDSYLRFSNSRLVADLFWSLAECHNDRIFQHSELALSYAREALKFYQGEAETNPRSPGIQQEIDMTEALIEELTAQAE